MKRFLTFLVTFWVGVALVACSSSSGGGTSAGGQAMKTLNDSLSNIKNFAPGGQAASRSSGGGDWIGSALVHDPRDSGGTCAHNTNFSPKEYMQIDFTESSTRCNGSDVNIFGRLRSALAHGCIVAHALSAPTSGDLPTSGTQTFTIDTSFQAMILADCHETIDADILGATATLTFSVPSDASVFDRQIGLTLVAGGVTHVQGDMFLSYNALRIAVASSEDNSNGSSRVIAIYDKATAVMKAEYLSKGKGATPYVYIHRLFYDVTNDDARVFSSVGAADVSQGIRYVVSGKPKTPAADLAMGLDLWGGAASGTYNAKGDYDLAACIQRSDGSIDGTLPTVTANAFTCGSVAGVDSAAITADATIAATMAGAATTWFVFSAAPSLAWDKTDMFTHDL